MEEESIASFYVRVIQEFNQLAIDAGRFAGTPINVPEVMELGGRVTLALLKKDSLRSQFADNVGMYYFHLCVFAWGAGVVAANEWHLDFEKFSDDDYLAGLVNSGIPPIVLARPISQDVIGFSKQEEQSFMESLFDKWIDLMKPKWDLPDSVGREYTFTAIKGCFDLGVEMTLWKHGFGTH